MPHTLSSVRSLVQVRLGDIAEPFHWLTDQLNQWINDGISDYSKYFQRRLVTQLDTLAGQQTYDLPADLMGIHEVEYPYGETPPKYLRRYDHQDPVFYSVSGLYDYSITEDATSAPILYLSDSPPADEQIQVAYSAPHALLYLDTDAVTIPDTHIEILLLYCRWVSLQSLASTENNDPDPASNTVNALELNAYRAERAYRYAISTALAAAGRSGVVPWQMDRHDRVY